MPSSPVSSLSAQEARPDASDSTPGRELAVLRAELDRLDDELQDLLQRRAEVVTRVGASAAKGTVKLRMGRQAAILRRLLSRHEGMFPPAAVVRVWLEMLSGTVAMQGPFTVAVYGGESQPQPAPGGGHQAIPDLMACAREQFGVLVPLRPQATAAQALAEVMQGLASVAVLPLPRDGELPSQAWWTRLLDHAEAAPRPDADPALPPAFPRLHVVARLPIWADRPTGVPAPAPALVVAGVPPDPSGEDRNLLALTLSSPDKGQAALAALRQAGLEPGPALLCQECGSQTLALVEVTGLLAEDDLRLSSLPGLSRPPVLLGGYALPLQDPRP